MPPPPSSQKPRALATRAEADRLLPLWIVAAVVVVICALAALAMGARWMNGTASTTEERDAPNWLTTDTVRATSGKGVVIKARVALDVPDADTRALINSRPTQVALLMQISVAEYDGGDDAGAERVQGMSEDIRTRLNGFLQAHQVPPVRDVVIQDLVLSKP